MKGKLRFRRTTIITVGLTCFLVGLALARSGNDLSLSIALVAVLGLIVSARQKSLVTLVAAISVGLSFGIIRGHAFLQQIHPYETLYGQEITLRAEALSDGIYADNGQLEFDASKVVIKSSDNLALPGKVQIQGLGVNAIYRGDIVEVNGKIFPAGGSRQGKISYSEVKVLGRSGEITEKVRREFVAGMQTALPEPHASFGLGLLVGQRNTLPDEVSEQLAIVGLTHIIAVSGYNLTIIVRGVRRLLGNRSKYQSTVISLLLVAFFLLLTGFSASIVRASIVSVLSIFAWYYGRTFKPLLIIALAAALTAGWSPIYIWSDIGWYLSFLAFFGVLVLAPLIQNRLLGKKQPKFLGQVVVESLSAQIMTAPLILYIFGEASLIALLSNAIIVPLVPFAMFLSAVAGIIGMLLPAFAGIISWPANFLMIYMLDAVRLLARIPHAHIEQAISLGVMIFMYALIISITLLLYRQLKAKYGTITDQNIIE